MRTMMSIGKRAEVLRCQASRTVAVGDDRQCEHPAKGEAVMYFAADGPGDRTYPACGIHMRMAAAGNRTVWRAT